MAHLHEIVHDLPLTLIFNVTEETGATQLIMEKQNNHE